MAYSDIHDGLMAVLTFVIAVGMVISAWASIKHLRALRDSESRVRTDESPSAIIVPVDYTVGDHRFVGASFTNTSRLDVTITSVIWLMRIPMVSKQGSESVQSTSRGVSVVEEFGGVRLSDTTPKRLRYGDRMRILFRPDLHMDEPLCPVFHDSLGRNYVKDTWIKWGKNSTTTMDPESGYLSTEETLRRNGGEVVWVRDRL